MGKTIGILGMGRIGKEVTIRARAFGMPVIAFDPYWDEEFALTHGVQRMDSAEEVMQSSDVISLHLFLSDESRDIVNAERLKMMKKGALLINCARGELVNTAAVAESLESEHLGGYGTDVLDEEPPGKDHPLLKAPRCIISPHIGSRTYESVVRQGTKSVENLFLALAGKQPRAQVNKVPVKASSEADRLNQKFDWIASTDSVA